MMTYPHVPGEIYEPEWVIEGLIARGQRPGYPVDRPSLELVWRWADRTREMGVRSVICILEKPQIAHYDHINLDGGGLFGFYRSVGLEVAHVEAVDHKRPPLNDNELDAVWEAFEKAEKPVLIHCSAGRDRTGAALDLILWKLGENDTGGDLA